MTPTPMSRIVIVKRDMWENDAYTGEQSLYSYEELFSGLGHECVDRWAWIIHDGFGVESHVHIAVKAKDKPRSVSEWEEIFHGAQVQLDNTGSFARVIEHMLHEDAVSILAKRRIYPRTRIHTNEGWDWQQEYDEFLLHRGTDDPQTMLARWEAELREDTEPVGEFHQVWDDFFDSDEAPAAIRMNYFIQADMRCVHQLAFLISVIESLYGNKGVFWVGGRIDSRKQRPFISEPVSDFRRRLNQYRGEATVVWLNMKSEHAGTCGKENCCSDNHDYQSVEYAHEYSPADIARQLGEESVVSLFSMQPCLGHPIVERLSQRMNIVVSCNPIERFIEDLAQVYTRAGIDPELAYEQFQIAMRSDQDEFVLETVQPAIDDPVDNTGMNVKRHYEVVARLPLVQRPFEETGNFHAHSSKSLEIINLKLLLPLFKLANALRSKYFGDDGDLRKID